MKVGYIYDDCQRYPISEHRNHRNDFSKTFRRSSISEEIRLVGRRTKVDRRRRHERKGTDGLASIGQKKITAIRSGINRRSSIRLDEHNLHAGRERSVGGGFARCLRMAGGLFFFLVSATFRENNCPSGINLTPDRYIYMYCIYYIHTIRTLKFWRRSLYFVDLVAATLRACIFFHFFRRRPPRLGL